jgi:hypothetical protein
MKTITIKINYKIDTPFFLLTLPDLTLDTARSPTFGSWYCYSPYLGKTYGGKYYVKHIVVPECPSVEHVWMTGCRPYNGPAAFFFDGDSGYGPFLFLEHFDLSPDYRVGTRYGKILRYSVASPDVPEVTWDY